MIEKSRADGSEDPYTAIEKRALDKCRPLRAQLELTYRCNFRCVMCYLVEFKSPDELTLPEYERVLDELAAMGCMTLTLTGGEPLLRKDFFDIAWAARKRGFAIRIFTNGSRIDDATAQKIADLNPIAVELSMYGASSETYREVTQTRTTYEDVESAVRRLRVLEVPVVLKTPVIKQNVDDVDALASLARETGCRILANPNITPKDNGDFSPLEHRLNDDEMVEYLEKYVPPREDKTRDPDDLMCNTARSAMVISPTGDVFPCVQIKESVGNVRERPLAEIWSGGPLLDELRSLRVRDFPTNDENSRSVAPGEVDLSAEANAGTGCSTGGCGSCSAQCAGVSRMATGKFTGGDPLARRMRDLKSRAHSVDHASSY